MVDAIKLSVPATPEIFDEDAYLVANPDVAKVVRSGAFRSGRQHFDAFGHTEGRHQRASYDLHTARAKKNEHLSPLLRDNMPSQRRGLKYDYLSAELRQAGNIADTENISAHGYDGFALAIIESVGDTGLILDCGAGYRPVYYSNVVNFEIVDYPTTDVLGVGEALPFEDGSFDAVLSIAVLEHVKDPFQCAREIIRVLKPGGRLLCTVPFLQPFHAYPHHYYNMTHMGARNLFEPALVIDDMPITGSVLPINALTWIVRSWATGLPEADRAVFLDMRLSELLDGDHLAAPWVQNLSLETVREIACGTALLAHKPE